MSHSLRRTAAGELKLVRMAVRAMSQDAAVRARMPGSEPSRRALVEMLLMCMNHPGMGVERAAGSSAALRGPDVVRREGAGDTWLPELMHDFFTGVTRMRAPLRITREEESALVGYSTGSSAQGPEALLRLDMARTVMNGDALGKRHITDTEQKRPEYVFRSAGRGMPKSVTTSGENDDLYKSEGVGEDAFFNKSNALGVADGVGSWSRHAGGNPARWSRMLMHYCVDELERRASSSQEPLAVLQNAYEQSMVDAKNTGLVGTSTALLAILANDELKVANIGDCSCFVIRNNHLVFQTQELNHGFNYPYQIGPNSSETPEECALTSTFKVQLDDIVIVSSDGLLDNLFEVEILSEISDYIHTLSARDQDASWLSSLSPFASGASAPSPPPRLNMRQFDPDLVSELLCMRAQNVTEDDMATTSPFQQKAQDEGIYYVGGKRDDITVVVAVVGEADR